MQKIQPRIQELQKKYKDDKERQAREMLAIYKNEKINPFSSLLFAIIQIPILIALYKVFWSGLDPKELSVLYSFVANPGHINSLFLYIIDLAKPNMVLAVLAGLTQYFQTKMLLPNNKKSGPKDKTSDFSQAMQTQMVYFAPVFTIIILIGLPSALGLYWTASSLFSIIQQYLIIKQNDNAEKQNI
jgi:YidC/Oxa1 family membrane protein insertase